VRLQLFALACNLGGFRHYLALPRNMKDWSLTTLRERATKIGVKGVQRAKYVTFQLAEVSLKRGLFQAILARIYRLRALPRAT